MEIIVAHLTYNLGDLEACSLTCRAWYTVAAPHLHHTLTLWGNGPDSTRYNLGPLYELHKLGLAPLVKEIRVEQMFGLGRWFLPHAFSHSDLRCFSVFSNVHTLKLQNLEICHFIPDIERHFGHLSPTLRSITLLNPNCTPRQLSHFLSSFPNLDDIEIERDETSVLDYMITTHTELAPLSGPKLRGRLVVHGFRWVETWTHLITLCGGLRFHHVDLLGCAGCVPALLEACAETIETLRFNAMDGSVGEQSCMGLSMDSS